MFGFKKRFGVRVENVENGLRTLARKLESLEEDHEGLKAQHLSLRGRVYATGAHKAPAEPQPAPTPVPTTRDALRRSSGFVPGQPMKHRE
jgi:hypothetical protein